MTQPLHQRKSVGAFGMLTWDEFLTLPEFPKPGDYAVVSDSAEHHGGTTGNTVAALATLGVDVALAARVGDDESGTQLRERLHEAGCDVEHVKLRPGTPTDRGIIIVSGEGESCERTIFWKQGARLRHGDHLPIEAFFKRDLVIVDVDDPRLRLLILDLPMHVSPRTRILGPLTFLRQLPRHQALELALRHDYITGNHDEFVYLTGEADLDAAVSRFQDEMILSQVRFAAISLGHEGCLVFDRGESIRIPGFVVDAVDPTGAGDAFAAGVAYGILNRWGYVATGRFANAMGALATRAIGARSSYPALEEVTQFLNHALEKVTDDDRTDQGSRPQTN